MAIKVVTQSPNIEALDYVADASTAYSVGTLGYRDTSTGELKTATSSTGTVLNIEAVIQKSVTTPASAPLIKALPIHPNMMVVVDCANDTAADQLNKAHAMSDGGTVNNTSTHVASTAGVFVALRAVGASTDRKLYGYFVKIGQVTA